MNETKSAIPRLSFNKIKDEILGKEYVLNLIITDSAKIKKLNKIYRDKDHSTDILSFPLSKTEGEIYISPIDAEKKSVEFGRDYDNFIAFLFIHGCVHLKGYDHGSRMEELEQKMRQKFGV